MQEQTKKHWKRYNTDEEPDYLTPQEAAEILRVTAGTLEVWRRTGAQDIPHSKIGKNVFYERKDIYAFMRSKKVGGDAH